MSEQPSQNGGAIFRFEHGVSFSSWGEIITITLTPFGPIQLRCIGMPECMVPTT